MTPIDTPDASITEDPENVSEAEFEEWVSNHGEAILDVLEEMTSVYHEDGETLDVEWAPMTAAPPGGEKVLVNPEMPMEMDPPVKGPNILRLLDDLVAHEMSHVNWSDLDAKKEFNQCYPGWGQIPGFVYNVLEDEYVDTRRKQKWYGMRAKLAYYVWLHMNTEKRAPPVDRVLEEEGRTNALVSALFQTALAGYVKADDEEAVPDYIYEFCSYADPIIERYKGTHDPRSRFKLAHVMMQLLIRYAPDPEEFDSDKMDERRRASKSTSNPGDAPTAMKPQVDLPEDLKEMLEDMLKELMEDGDFPMPEPEEGEGEGAVPESPEVESGGDGDVDADSEGVSETSGDADGDDEDGDGDGGEGVSETSDGDGDTDASDEKSSGNRIRDVFSKYSPDRLKVVNE